jgi:hypothetical protein
MPINVKLQATLTFMITFNSLGMLEIRFQNSGHTACRKDTNSLLIETEDWT